jgi:hypothetical protein
VWQVLLDPQPGEFLFPPVTSNPDIAKKLKEALLNIQTNDSPAGSIKLVHTLRNGGIIVKLDNERLASWLWDPVGRTLMEGFHKHTFALVLEYLPIQLQIENEGFLQAVKDENDLPANSLAIIRRIKSLNHRTQEQHKAFVILHITGATIANNILRDGLCINNEHIRVHKDKKELIRCVKCQQFSHIACVCSAPLDICSTCGRKH